MGIGLKRATGQDGNGYSIRWMHIKHPMRHPNSIETDCVILDNTDKKPIGVGVALCVAGDNFCKNIGRKLSLTRALKKVFPKDKDARRIIWKQYYIMRGGKW